MILKKFYVQEQQFIKELRKNTKCFRQPGTSRIRTLNQGTVSITLRKPFRVKYVQVHDVRDNIQDNAHTVVHFCQGHLPMTVINVTKDAEMGLLQSASQLKV